MLRHLYSLPLLFILSIALQTTCLNAMSNSSPPSLLSFRRFQPSDTAAILSIFQANLTEEWTKYHDARYLPNAKSYIESCLAPDSDLNNIESVYFEPGGFFWVVVCHATNEKREETICGMVGLQVLDNNDCNDNTNNGARNGELRRMCLIPSKRNQGWGTKMGELVQNKARELQLDKVLLSTPEHGDDVLRFYKRLGFQDTGKRLPIHNSPIQEVFLEWNVQ